MAKLQLLSITFGRLVIDCESMFSKGLKSDKHQVEMYLVLASFVNGGLGLTHYEFASKEMFLRAFETPAAFFNALLDSPEMNVEGNEWREQDYFDAELGLLNHVAIDGAWPWNNFPCRMPVDEPVLVRQPWKLTGAPSEWGLTRVTNRYGELCDEHEATRTLGEKPAILDRLSKQLITGSSCIARLDGQYGVLYERHFKSADTDSDSEMLPTCNFVNSKLTLLLWKFRDKYLQLEFCVPIKKEGVRPCLWVFIPDGALTFHERAMLVTDLSESLQETDFVEVGND